MTVWWHRCCEHSAAGIDEAGGFIIPKRQAVLGVSLSWFTYDPHAPARALGLAGHELVACDRMEYLYRIDDGALIQPWRTVRADWHLSPLLEAARGTVPGLWGVARVPVRGERVTP